MVRRLEPYRTIFSLGLQNSFVYRWNFFIRSLFGLVPLAATIWIWRAIYEETGEDIAGYGFREMVFYFVAVTVVEMLVSPTDDEWQIAADIREGRISAFLLRPLNYLGYRSTMFLSARAVYAGVASIPVLVMAVWLPTEASFPKDAVTWLVFFVSLGMAAAIQFLIAFVLATLAFWVLEISTLVFILYSFEYFLSGRIFPIDVMPENVALVLRALPFPYELYFPVSVLMGKSAGAEMWTGLAIQAGWMIGLFLLSRWVWKRGVERYGAYGG